MNKDELIEAVASKTAVAKKDAAAVVEGALDEITKTLSGGGEVKLTGFGTFSISKRGARQGVNPRTGEKIQIAASNAPKFKAGKGLKDAVK